nr:MAG TPA: hypothetical protein [Caudoviricetes sp.]
MFGIHQGILPGFCMTWQSAYLTIYNTTASFKITSPASAPYS